VEVDSLRGMAAMSVVLFHYTTRLRELFPETGSAGFSVPSGHYGVNLFFVISGFVIFMTLDRTARARDFWLSRLSRLFPAYWVAIAVTFTICHVLGLPGKLVSLNTAVANMAMLHGLFGVAHVDGVYWTLEVEMLFYCGMFLLYRLRCMDHAHWVICAFMLLRIAHGVAQQNWGMGLPWLVYRLLILQYLPWFGLGIAVFLLANRKETAARRGAATMSAIAIATLWICESATVAVLGVVFASLVYLAARSQLTFLRFGPLVWLGAISFPLYLLHENIGWAIQLRLVSLHLPMEIALPVALSTSLLLADLCARWVERPAMRWARSLRRRI
jgi:peptidoglycan/LPS O-acetylase OafA/YrhL